MPVAIPSPDPGDIDLEKMSAAIGLDVGTIIICLTQLEETTEARWQHDRRVAAGFYANHMGYREEGDMLRNILTLRKQTGSKFDMGVLSIAVRFLADRRYRIQTSIPVA